MLAYLRRVVLIAIALVALDPAFADEWMPPVVKTYYSADKHSRFTVTPREISGPLAYFQDKVDNKDKAGQQPGSTQTSARGVLEKLGTDGRWTLVWDRSLVNDVSPVNALVANGATYVATFDNWHSMGWGDDAVVIYGEGGRLVRAYGLKDLLPDYYVRALPRTVSSVWWSGEHRISANLLVLSIVVPKEDTGPFENRTYVEITVRMTDGVTQPADSSAWEKACAEAKRSDEIQRAAEAENERWFKSPLLPPTNTSEPDWHRYLGEAYFRLEGTDGYPATEVLRDPRAKDYAPSVKWLRDALHGHHEPGDCIMMASPASPENLLKVLAGIVRDMKPNALKGVRVYVVVPLEFRERLVALLAPTGANFIHIDPTVPIPQRPERIKRFDGE